MDHKLTTAMLLANGDIGVVAGNAVDRQTFYFGKSDFCRVAVKTPHARSCIWQESQLGHRAGTYVVSL